MSALRSATCIGSVSCFSRCWEVRHFDAAAFHTSDQVNFHEFYGIFDIWDGCPERSRDSDYLVNGIGIATTAVFMLPLIRAKIRNSHHDRYGKIIESICVHPFVT